METIVALGVIMTGLVSVISLTISNLNAERDAATRYQAVNLARETIELVRNMRDSNWISGADAWEGITLGDDIVPLFNPADPAVARLEQGGEARVMQCGDGHFVQGTPFCSDPSLFSRTLTITERTCLQLFETETEGQCTQIKKTDRIALAVAAKVTWQTPGGGQHEVILDEIFYDWR